MVKPKKSLGQHFLKDLSIASKIAEQTRKDAGNTVLEIGPGEGALTQFLLPIHGAQLILVELDSESIPVLISRFPELEGRILHQDFLGMDLSKLGESISIVGNFPYNISSQILFSMLEHKARVKSLTGMFQKEVAKRIASKPGSKEYGILSVFCQAFYQVEYLFTVPPSVFRPPPKVDSGVIRLQRKEGYALPCDEKFFRTVVKVAFNQRRKTLRNSLKSLGNGSDLSTEWWSGKRPEQLDFIAFTEIVAFLQAT